MMMLSGVVSVVGLSSVEFVKFTYFQNVHFLTVNIGLACVEFVI